MWQLCCTHENKREVAPSPAPTAKGSMQDRVPAGATGKQTTIVKEAVADLVTQGLIERVTRKTTRCIGCGPGNKPHQTVTIYLQLPRYFPLSPGANAYPFG